MNHAKIVNDNVNRLKIFTKMHALVNEPSQYSSKLNSKNLNFSVRITRQGGFVASITYKIGGNNILTKQCSIFEECVIQEIKNNKCIDEEGNIQTSLTPEDIQTAYNKQHRIKQKTSARKIGKAYRRYAQREDNNYRKPNEKRLVDIEARKTLHEMMAIVDGYFKSVPAADVVNGTDNASTYSSNKHRRNNLEYFVKNEKRGNCEELSIFLFQLIQLNANISTEIKKQTKLARLQKPDDHMIIVIGDIESDDATVIDPWLKFIDLKPLAGYRTERVVSTDRKRGFMGTKSQYIEFISNHEDGKYVTFVYKHIIVERQLQDIKSSKLSLFHDLATEYLKLSPQNQ